MPNLFTFKGRINRLQYVSIVISAYIIFIIAMIVGAIFPSMHTLCYTLLAVILIINWTAIIRRLHDLNRPSKVFAFIFFIFFVMSLISSFYRIQNIMHYSNYNQINAQIESLEKETKLTPKKPDHFDKEGFAKDTKNMIKQADLKKKAAAQLQLSNDLMLISKMWHDNAVFFISLLSFFLAMTKSFPAQNKHGYPAEIPDFLAGPSPSLLDRFHLTNPKFLIAFFIIYTCLIGAVIYKQQIAIIQLQQKVSELGDQSSIKKLQKKIGTNKSDISSLYDKVDDFDDHINESNNTNNYYPAYNDNNIILESQIKDLKQKIDDNDAEMARLKRDKLFN